MPHVIVRDPPDLRGFYESFEPWQGKLEDGSRIEGRSVFLRQDGKAVLVQGFCLELGPPTHFFVIVEVKDGRGSIRLYPHPSPARTCGVQAVVARVAHDFLERGGEVERTNLSL